MIKGGGEAPTSPPGAKVALRLAMKPQGEGQGLQTMAAEQ